MGDNVRHVGNGHLSTATARPAVAAEAQAGRRSAVDADGECSAEATRPAAAADALREDAVRLRPEGLDPAGVLDVDRAAFIPFAAVAGKTRRQRADGPETGADAESARSAAAADAAGDDTVRLIRDAPSGAAGGDRRAVADCHRVGASTRAALAAEGECRLNAIDGCAGRDGEPASSATAACRFRIDAGREDSV